MWRFSGKNQLCASVSSYKDTKKNSNRHLSVSKKLVSVSNAVGFFIQNLYMKNQIHRHAYFGNHTSYSDDGTGILTAAISTAISMVKMDNKISYEC